MKLESVGIIVALRPFSERDSVAHIFTRDFGVLVGMMRGAACARKNRPMIGVVGNVSWNARLDSQLGVFHWEQVENPVATLIFNRDKLMHVNAMLGLIDVLLPEREEYKHLYDVTINTLNKMITDSARENYQKWEVQLLQDLGYALDLSHCSGCGRHNNLNYLSPRTGRAVCDDCAAPYIERLYKLPLNLGVTIKFVEQICIAQGIQMPNARKMLNL